MENILVSTFDGKIIDGLEFCRLAYEHFESIRQQPGGATTLRTRQRPVKRLIEEIFPICRYVQSIYGPGRYISVKWVEGKQYDAEIITTGISVEQGHWPGTGKLEVTQAMHKNEYLMREKLSTDGHAFGLDGLNRAITEDGKRVVESVPTVINNGSYIDDFVEIMMDAILEKISKIYPADTTLIVDCTLNSAYHRLEWEALIRRVREKLPAHKFMQIFACSADGHYASFV
jgi:hypothetical protein